MVGNTFDVSNIAVQRFEQECRQRFAAAEVNFQRLITYQQTGRHVAGLTSNERKQVLRLAANFHWDEEKNILYYKRNREVVRNMEKVTSVMEHNHINAVGGHSGWNATWEKVSHVYYWKNMAKDIQYYIATCTTCQRFTPLKTHASEMQPICVKEPMELVGVDEIGGANQEECYQTKDVSCLVHREMSAMKTSKKSGAGTKDIYTPKLWCYDELLFLAEGGVVRASTYNLDEGETTQQVDGNQRQEERVPDCQETPMNAAASWSKPTLSVSHKRKSDVVGGYKQRLLEKAKKCLDQKEDECDSFSKFVAVKLRNMSETQRLFAEKQIMDILYNGAMNTISTRSEMSTWNEDNN